jgi:hypothetical protein
MVVIVIIKRPPPPVPFYWMVFRVFTWEPDERFGEGERLLELIWS